MLPQQANSQTPWMMTEGGKDAIFKLLNRAALPGVGDELQLVDLPGPLFSTPAVWTDGSSNAWIFMGFSDVVQAYRLQTNGSGVSMLVGIWHTSPGQTGGEGTSPVVANGIVFVAFDGGDRRARRTRTATSCGTARTEPEVDRPACTGRARSSRTAGSTAPIRTET